MTKKIFLAVAMQFFLSFSANYATAGALRMYKPQGRFEMNGLSLEMVLKNIEQGLSKGYAKTESGEKVTKEHPEAKIKVILDKKDQREMQQPVFLFYNRDKILDNAYFSNIDEVNCIRLEDGTKNLVFSYRTLVKGKFPYSKIDYFDLKVERCQGITEAVETLAIDFKRRELGISKEKIRKVDSSAQKEITTDQKPKPSSFLLYEQKLICEGKTIKNKEIKYAGKIAFTRDRVYDPESKYAEGGNDLVKSIQTILKKDPSYKIMLVCGNASSPPASKCSLKKDACNDGLCWNRAYFTSNYLRGRLKEKLNNLNEALYITGTSLNERSARIYLVKNR